MDESEKRMMLGRVYVPDERDKNYPLARAIPAAQSSRKYRYWWDQAWWGNQGRKPWCVAYAWLHWLEDGPVTHFYEGRNFDPAYLNENAHEKHQSLFKPRVIYENAQKVDRWPGENYDGTSVRAGAKILRNLGVIEEYRWANSIDDVVNALLELGPLVVGTWWYNDMFRPNEETALIHPSGGKAGGHAYVLNGVNVEKGLLRIKNSWGRAWGKNGHAYITFDDFNKLLHDYGEACMAFEKKLKK